MIAQQWKAIGIQLDVSELERNLGMTRMRNNEHQIFMWANDGSELLYAFPRHAMPVDPAEPMMGPLIGAVVRHRRRRGDEAERRAACSRRSSCYDQAGGQDTEQSIETAQEIWKILVDRRFSIGTVGVSPAVMGDPHRQEHHGQHPAPPDQHAARPHAAAARTRRRSTSRRERRRSRDVEPSSSRVRSPGSSDSSTPTPDSRGPRCSPTWRAVCCWPSSRVWAISVLAFVIIQLPPGDFVDTYIAKLSASGSGISADQAEQLRTEYGLDQPIYVQYWRWMRLMLPRRLRDGDGVAAAGHRGHRRPALADDGRLARRGAADLGRRLPIGIYSAVRPVLAGATTLFTFLGFLGPGDPDFLLGLLVLYFGFAYFNANIGGLFSPEYADAPWSWAKWSTC